MGLDMYLSAEKFVSGYNHDKDENFEKILGLFNVTENDAHKSITVKITVGYWRKANAIHNWFVQNVQDGRDECQHSYVTVEKLLELKSDCEDAIAAYNSGDKETAENLIPPTNGFFFGSTEVDDYYMDDLVETVKIINTCLEKFKGFGFYYQSSW
jgi:hypothetical protein